MSIGGISPILIGEGAPKLIGDIPPEHVGGIPPILWINYMHKKTMKITVLILLALLLTGTMWGQDSAEAGDFTIVGDPSHYSFKDDTLTITGGDLTVGNTNPQTASNQRIIIKAGESVDPLHITIENLNIDNYDTNGYSALSVKGGEVHLTLKGVNTLKGGSGKAALGLEERASIVIDAATADSKLTAHARYDGAGIGTHTGFGNKQYAGRITINGGVIDAYTQQGGAAIGSGSFSECAGVTISGGNINAKTSWYGNGIGSGWQGKCGEIRILQPAEVLATGNKATTGNNSAIASNNGMMILYAEALSTTDVTDISGNYLFYSTKDKTITVTGTFSLPEDLTVDSDYTLNIPAGSALIIPEGTTLTNNGKIQNSGTLKTYDPEQVKGDGTLTNEGDAEYIVDVPLKLNEQSGALALAYDHGWRYAASDGVKHSFNGTVEGTTEDGSLTIETGGTLTFRDVNVTATSTPGLVIAKDAGVKLDIKGFCHITSTGNAPVQNGGSLEVNGYYQIYLAGQTTQKLEGVTGTVVQCLSLSAGCKRIDSGKGLCDIPAGCNYTGILGSTSYNLGMVLMAEGKLLYAIPEGGGDRTEQLSAKKGENAAYTATGDLAELKELDLDVTPSGDLIFENGVWCYSWEALLIPFTGTVTGTMERYLYLTAHTKTSRIPLIFRDVSVGDIVIYDSGISLKLEGSNQGKSLSSDSSLQIEGTGSLTVSYIDNYGLLDITGGTLVVDGYGFYNNGEVSITGGNLTVSGSSYSLYSNNDKFFCGPDVIWTNTVGIPTLQADGKRLSIVIEQVDKLPAGETVAYQWQKDGQPIKDATQAEFKATDYGTFVYNCVVKHSGVTFITKSKSITNIPYIPPVSYYYTVTLPEVEGATLSQRPGGHTVEEGYDFSFTLTLDAAYDQSVPVVTTSRGETLMPDIVGRYRIRNVEEDITVSITGIFPNDDPTANAAIAGEVQVKAIGSVLYIYTPNEVPVSIFTLTGTLLKQQRTAGSTDIRLPAGMYLIRVDGRTYKVVIR